MQEKPRVGIGVIVCRNGKFLLGKRKNAHGDGTWAPPGGHLEFGETPEETAQREVMEETGMEVINTQFAGMTNDIFVEERKHYVTLWMMCDWSKNEPRVVEPDKFLEQTWVDFERLPENLFLPLQNLKKSQFFSTVSNRLSITKRKAHEV